MHSRLRLRRRYNSYPGHWVPEKDFLVPIGYETGQAPAACFGKEEAFLPLPKIESDSSIHGRKAPNQKQISNH
jgi:hypothetical protein